MEANQPKPTSLVVMSLSIALVGAVMFDLYKNRLDFDKSLENASVTAAVDSLSFVKENLKKDVETAARNLQRKADKMNMIVEKYNDINSSIEQKTVLLRKFKSQNAELRDWGRDGNRQVALLNKQIEDLNVVKNKLENEAREIPALKEDLVKHKTSNDSLTVLYVEKEKAYEKVSKDLNEVSNYLTADHFRVEVLNYRKNITSLARKGKSLKISLTIPEYLKKLLTDHEKIYVTVYDSKNQPVAGLLTENISTQGENMPIKFHASQSIELTRNPLELQMNVPLSKRLNPGIYAAKFHTTQKYLGSVGFTLKNGIF
ncbi:hypothetical protein GVN16_25105 [Emticicia sp. CRIBPO]|uniref:hypothetical protein n=1 Tax=Emticicia sp. CRIBPO TaxID=2683258 RepID=UPI001412A2DD|nr:hypothetical protein [Emticicia sp. CRIBPO]NBA89080.1 hypothetical protein [Emticicia sp. CRIBPO]